MGFKQEHFINIKLPSANEPRGAAPRPARLSLPGVQHLTPPGHPTSHATALPLVAPLPGTPFPPGYLHPSSLEYPTSDLAGAHDMPPCIPPCLHPVYLPAGAPHIAPLLGTCIPPHQGLRIPSHQGSLFPTLLQVLHILLHLAAPHPCPLGHPTTHASHPHHPVGHPTSHTPGTPHPSMHGQSAPHAMREQSPSPGTQTLGPWWHLVPQGECWLGAGEGRQPECLPAALRRQELTLPGLIWKSPSCT